MAEDTGMDSRGEALPTVHKSAGRRYILGRVGDPRYGKIQDPLADDGPHSCKIYGLDGFIHVKIAVGKGGGAGHHHLGTGQERAPKHRVRVDKPFFGWKNELLQPGFQGQVIGQAPEEGHGPMGVGID